MPKFLFLGGPKHGQILDVEDDSNEVTYYVKPSMEWLPLPESQGAVPMASKNTYRRTTLKLDLPNEDESGTVTLTKDVFVRTGADRRNIYDGLAQVLILRWFTEDA